MRQDDRQKCSQCHDYLNEDEFVHKVKFGHWDSEENSFERGGSYHNYCRECWSSMKPMARGAQYEPDSPQSLKNIIKASDGDLSVDFGSLVIGSRVYVSYLGGSWCQCAVKNRMIGGNTIGANVEYSQINEDELDDFLSNVLEEGDLPSIVSLMSTDKTPFNEYPNLTNKQSRISDF